MAMELIILINYTCAFPAKCEKELQKNKKNVFTDLFAISITTTLKNVALSGAFNTQIKSVLSKALCYVSTQSALTSCYLL